MCKFQRGLFTFRGNNRQRHNKGSAFPLTVLLCSHCLKGYFSTILGHYAITDRKSQSCPLSYLSCSEKGIEYPVSVFPFNPMPCIIKEYLYPVTRLVKSGRDSQN